MTAADEVRRLCAVMWPGLIVTRTVYELPQTSTRRGRRADAPRVHVIHVGRSMLAEGTEIGRGDTADAAWADALAALPQRIAERVAEIDREAAALAEERARLACLTTAKGVQP